MKENKGYPHGNKQQQGNGGQPNPQGKKGGSCECPTSGSGNNAHRGGSHNDERGKYNKPNGQSGSNPGNNNNNRY